MDEMENSEVSEPEPARVSGRLDDKAARRDRVRPASHTSPVGRLSQFLRDVRAELKRVSWPSAKEVKNTTIITLIAVIFFAAYLFAVDQGWARFITGLDWLLNKVVG